ncbi:MAG: TRAP transporter small permease [Lentisphaerales bacterium]|nr:TRAP transporter small permease [Lentisphaerales bacterium]
MPRTEKLKSGVNFLLDWLQKIFNTAAIVFLLGIVFVVLFQIFARYALPKAPVWTEELSRFLFIYTIIFASASVIIQERHVNLELFQHRLSEKWSLRYKIFFHLLVAVFSVVLLQYAWKYALIGKRQTSPAMGLKMSWIFGSSFVFFVLVSLSTVLLAIKDSLTLIEKRGE